MNRCITILFFGCILTSMAIADSHCRYCGSSQYGSCAYSPSGHHEHISGRSSDFVVADLTVDPSLTPQVGQQTRPDETGPHNISGYYATEEPTDVASFGRVKKKPQKRLLPMIKKIPWWGWGIIVWGVFFLWGLINDEASSATSQNSSVPQVDTKRRSRRKQKGSTPRKKNSKSIKRRA